MPIGKRPTPKVARGKSPRYDTSSGSYSGSRGTKKPTGSRPTPSVARDTATPGRVAGRPSYPKKTPMPAPKAAWGNRGGGKPHGGS